MLPAGALTTRRDRWRDAAAVTLVAALARFPALYTPRTPVFDEVHTVRFVSDYLAHRDYVDVHPPLAMQLFAGWARLLGFDGATFPALQPVAGRLPVAIAGTLLAPLVLVMLRRLGAPRRAALLAATCVALDNALVLQSRLMLADLLLVTAAIAAITTWLGTRDHRRIRAPSLAIAGLLAGVAVSIKWTGLSALGLMLLFEARGFIALPEARPRVARRGAILVGGAALVYLVVFAVHFAVMDHGSTQPFLARLWERQRLMLSGDVEIEAARHFYASPWYSWPLMIRPMHYWTSNAGPGRAQDIYLLGNPLVWWGSFAILLGAVVRLARARGPRPAGLAVPIAGFALNLLPFAAIGRPMFLYHYLLALVFGICAAATVVARGARWSDEEPAWRLSSRRGDVAFWGAIAAVAIVFLFFAPVTYGWSLEPAALKLRLWLPGWG